MVCQCADVSGETTRASKSIDRQYILKEVVKKFMIILLFFVFFFIAIININEYLNNILSNDPWHVTEVLMMRVYNILKIKTSNYVWTHTRGR